jgi:hypothetical protein
MQKLRRKNQRLTEELRKAAIVIDVQKSGRSVGLALAEGGARGETLRTPSPIWPPQSASWPPAMSSGWPVLPCIASVRCSVRRPRRRPQWSCLRSGRRQLDPLA